MIEQVTSVNTKTSPQLEDDIMVLVARIHNFRSLRELR
jgi:hypothetical protein